MTTYPLPTLGPTISSTGVTIPSFTDIWSSLQASFKAIYGQDAYIESDSQDGQWLGVIAQGYNDVNNAFVAVYNSYSPATAQGTALSSNVKINGLQRETPSNSSADVSIIGVAGTEINNGIISDENGNQWSLPSYVLVPSGGVIVVTATCLVVGAIVAVANTITTITTPTRGWQTVTNPEDAVVGAPVEQDPALRARQTTSTALPAQTIIEALEGELGNITGVQQARVFENNTGSTDGNGIPAHAIACVVEGGDAMTIANAINVQKTPGAPTYGTTSEIVVDPNGVPKTVYFTVPTIEQILVEIFLTPLTGYTATIGDAIVAAIVAAINAEGIYANQGTLYRTPLIGTAYSAGPAGTYIITDIQIAISPNAVGDSDLTIAFNQLPACSTGNVTLTVA